MRKEAIDSRVASGHGDQMPATRQRVGGKPSKENRSASSLRVAGGRPAIASSTAARASARALGASGPLGNAPSSSTGMMAATIACAPGSRALGVGRAGGEVGGYSQRASNSAAAPAIPALRSVRRLMRSVVGSEFGTGEDCTRQMALVPGTLAPTFRENNLD